ncbi:MAG: TlpA family protein disulfide reductase [Deltaproteobacteria bacterium]|nr:MAG: TlpA family protein disulfide reductase [Deltaproteobacteria bacterium]
MSTSAKRAAAATATVAIAGFLIVRFVLMLDDAVAREEAAACTALRPSPPNDAFRDHPLGDFPIPAPDFAAQDVDGNMRRLSDFRGQVVFLNFWAPWCPPCREEVPSIEQLQRELGDEPFVVLALASSRDWPSVLVDFPEGTPMTVLLDPPASEDEQIGKIARAYGVPALPETFVIDKQGYIRHYFVNKRDWKSDIAVTCLRSLIEEKDTLPWLRSWLWTMSQTSSGSS